MSIDRQYELLGLIAKGPTKTFKAKEIASGRHVFLHLFDAQSDRGAQDSLLEKLDFLVLTPPSSGPLPILDVVRSIEPRYVVTEVLEPFTNLRTWVETHYQEIRQTDKSRWVVRIHSLLGAEDQEGALEIAREASADFPGDGELQNLVKVIDGLLRGRKLWEEGFEEEGIERLRRCHSLDQRNPHVRGALVKFLVQRAEGLVDADWEGARREVQEVLELDPTHKAAKELGSRIDHRRDEYIFWCLTQCHHLLGQGDSPGALAVLERGLASCPDSEQLVELRNVLGEKSKPRKERGQPSKEGESKAASALRSVADRVRNLDWVSKLWSRLQPLLSALISYLRRLARLFPGLPSLDKKWRRGLLAAVATTLLLVATGLGIWSFGRSAPREAPAPLASLPSRQLIQIKSVPAGAIILVDGQQCGTSTCQLELEGGRHQLEATLIGYHTTELTLDLDPLTPRAGEGVVLELEPWAPFLRVSADLDSGEVSLDGEVLGELQDGEFEVELDSLAPGEHTLEVSGRGAAAGITFESAPGLRATVHGRLRTRNLNAAVVSSLGPTAAVLGDEFFSMAELDGVPLEETSKSGAELSDLQEGAHEVTLKAGRKEWTISFDSAERPLLAAYLKSDPNVGALRIATGQDGVAVFLNGRKYRRRTRDGRIFIYLYPNKYTVRVEKDGFLTPPEQIAEIRKDGQVRLDFKMDRTAKLIVHDGLEGAEVFLDGVLLGRISGDGGFTASELKPGHRTVLLRNGGYQPKSVERNFAPGETVRLAGGLSETLGTLRVDVTPGIPDLKMMLRLEGEAEVRTFTEKSLELPPGTYTVTASPPGFNRYSATARVDAGRTKTIKLILQREQEREPPKPSLALADWEKSGGWVREGDLLVRRGGKFALAPAEPGAGTYTFVAILKKGRRLQWVLNYQDENNYLLFQLGKNYFHRIQMAAGNRTKPVRFGHQLSTNEFLTIRMSVSGDSILQQAKQDGEWVLLDEWKHTDAGFAGGRFGFHVPGRDQIGLSSINFVPKPR